MPIGADCFWRKAMGVGTPLQEVFYGIGACLGFSAFVLATGSIVICIWRGSRDQRSKAMLSIPIAFAVFAIQFVVAYAGSFLLSDKW